MTPEVIPTREKLSEDQIWEKVRKLFRKTVYIDKNRPYEIIGATSEIVVIEKANVRPHKRDVYRVYLRLLEDGYVATDNMPKGIMKPGQSLRVVLAIIVAILPDDIEIFQKGRVKGIRFIEQQADDANK